MKFGFPHAASAIAAALAMAGPARADDAPTYDSVAQCAAFNLLLAQASSASGDAADDADDKDQTDRYTKQAVALAVVATEASNADSGAVAADIRKKHDAMAALASNKAVFGKLLDENFDTCTSMGKAAKAVVDEQLDMKK